MASDPGGISGIPVVVNGVVSLQQPATLQSEFAGKTVTASVDFEFSWNGTIVNFFANMTTVVTADLLAALEAQGAPISTP